MFKQIIQQAVLKAAKAAGSSNGGGTTTVTGGVGTMSIHFTTLSETIDSVYASVTPIKSSADSGSSVLCVDVNGDIHLSDPTVSMAHGPNINGAIGNSTDLVLSGPVYISKTLSLESGDVFFNSRDNIIGASVVFGSSSNFKSDADLSVMSQTFGDFGDIALSVENAIKDAEVALGGVVVQDIIEG